MEKGLPTLDPSWPPPPPPMYESSDLVFEGQDEIDFPPPPPPDMQESFIVNPEKYKMVRLRTVNVEDQVDLLSQEGTETIPDQDPSLSSQLTPQKPIRKSCIKSMQSPVKASPGPSMCLQEAIRMKTAAMSSSGFPARPSLRLPTPTANSNDVPVSSPKTPDDCKSPVSTASFIFSKSTKKVVIETATSPEAQASLKQSLAAELMQISDHQKSMVTNGTKKHHKVPPPVAKKPVYATSPSEKVTKLTTVGSSSKQKNGVANNQPAGQQVPSTTGPGRLAVINGTMNSAVYQKILKENVRPSVCDLKLKRTWVLQQDNDPKHTSKSTSEWLKKNKMKTLEWPSQSPDLNPIEMLWHDLKKVVHARKPSNVAELQQFCKDEGAKIPPQRCNRLIASYGKRLIAVVAAKGGPTSY
ncbi:hypothetical protein QTP86_003241 [Hemibagrus guttatus]|nr:hypothetical protein QTP86_003241 [Hemibagrus guttatus]